MELRQKKKILISSILLAILSFNIVGVFFAYTLTPTKGIPARTPAAYGTIDIQKNADTENLGYIDDDNISLFWFIRVTDIHLGSNPVSPHVLAYGNFLNWTYDYIHPFTTVVTGDLNSGQRFESYASLEGTVSEEYELYFNLANHSKYATDPNPYRYLDAPGNHDRNSDWGAGYYLNYTMQGTRLHTLQSFFSANFSSGTALYSILDSTPYCAPPTFFGSEGNFEPIDIHEYSEFLGNFPTAEHKFAFMHQHPLDGASWGGINAHTGLPTDMNILNDQYNLDTLFYGHTHMNFVETYGDIVVLMGDRFRDDYEAGYDPQYPYAPTQYYFNIVSVDGGGMNYVNVPFTNKTYILITNPTNPLFLDGDDGTTNTRGDGNVRALIFTDPSDPIASVEYQIDGGSWIAMYPYNDVSGSSSVLYESSRLSPAIPSDGLDHNIKVRAETTSGNVYVQTAISTSQELRLPFWQNIILFILLGFAGIAAFINRDNYPLKRSDGRHRRLTHEEKIKKRNEINAKRNKPWWLPILGFTVFLSFVLVPMGIFPIFQGTPGIVYPLFVYHSQGVYFLLESLLFPAGKLLLIFPPLYYGIRTYHPEAVQWAGLLCLANTAFILYMAIDHYGILGLLTPAGYIDAVIGIIILVGNFPHTRFGLFLREKLFQRRK
jgi:hypothetical protein